MWICMRYPGKSRNFCHLSKFVVSLYVFNGFKPILYYKPVRKRGFSFNNSGHFFSPKKRTKNSKKRWGFFFHATVGNGTHKATRGKGILAKFFSSKLWTVSLKNKKNCSDFFSLRYITSFDRGRQ